MDFHLFLVACVLGATMAVDPEDLCGDWRLTAESLGQHDCLSLVECGTTRYAQRRLGFVHSADDEDVFTETEVRFSGNSCNPATGEYSVDITGIFILNGNETGLNDTDSGNETGIIDASAIRIRYDPLNFTVLVHKKQAEISLGPEQPCVNAVDYLNDNCPCEGVWEEDVSRTITKDDCPEGTCDEMLIFNDALRYGTLSLYANLSARNGSSLNVSATSTDPFLGYQLEPTTWEMTRVSDSSCPSDPVPAPESSGLTGGEIVGIVIGILVFLLLVGLCVYCLCVRKRSSEGASLLGR